MDFTPRKLPFGQHQCNAWARNSSNGYQRCKRRVMCKRFISREHRYFFYYCGEHCKYAVGEEFPHGTFKGVAVYTACEGKVYPQYQGIADKEYTDPHFRSNDANLPDIAGRPRKTATVSIHDSVVKAATSTDVKPVPSVVSVSNPPQDSALIDELVKLLDTIPELNVKPEPQTAPRLVIITPSGRMVNRNYFSSNSQPYQAPPLRKPAEVVWKMYLQSNPVPSPPFSTDNRFQFIGA